MSIDEDRLLRWLAELEADRDRCRSEVEALRAELASARAQVSPNARLRDDLARAEREIEQLRRQYETANGGAALRWPGGRSGEWRVNGTMPARYEAIPYVPAAPIPRSQVRAPGIAPEPVPEPEPAPPTKPGLLEIE